MMSFVMQTNEHKQMIDNIKIDCCDWNKCYKECCFLYVLDIDTNLLQNNNFFKKLLKIKLFSFVDIFWKSSYFLENNNLIKLNSPPYIIKKVKYYSYSDLIKIIKSNT